MDPVQIPGTLNFAKFFLFAVIVLMVVLAFAGVTDAVDKQWTPQSVLSDGNRQDQCEQLNFKTGTMAGTVLEVENTWSNAAYLLAGVLILVCTKRPLGYVVGVQLCVLALFSGMYHGTLQDNWRTLDVAGIYFVLWALLLYGLQAALLPTRFDSMAPPWDSLLEWGAGLILGVVSTYEAYQMAEHRSDVYFFSSTTLTFTLVTALIVLCTFQMGRTGFDWWSSVKLVRLWTVKGSPPADYWKFWRMFWWHRQDTAWNHRSYFWAFALIGVPGVVCRLLDGDGRPFCSPGSPVQAHAIWHIFGAASLLLCFDLLAWSSDFDHPVFVRLKPQIPGDLQYRWGIGPVYGTAIASVVFGAALFVLSFIDGAFVDSPHKGDPPSAPVDTGITIASVFLLFGFLLFVLRKSSVIDDPKS